MRSQLERRVFITRGCEGRPGHQRTCGRHLGNGHKPAAMALRGDIRFGSIPRLAFALCPSTTLTPSRYRRHHHPGGIRGKNGWCSRWPSSPSSTCHPETQIAFRASKIAIKGEECGWGKLRGSGIERAGTVFPTCRTRSRRSNSLRKPGERPHYTSSQGCRTSKHSVKSLPASDIIVALHLPSQFVGAVLVIVAVFKNQPSQKCSR